MTAKKRRPAAKPVAEKVVRIRHPFFVGWRKHAAAAVGLCALIAIAYANSLDAGFTLDSLLLILYDPRIREATSQNVSLIFSHTYWWPNGEAGIYRPLTTLSYLLNGAILGDANIPNGYHRINLALHGLNVLLVYALGLRLLRAFRMALFVAILWAVHPVLTESITNIIGRSDLLSATGVLGGFLLYLLSVDSKGWRRAPALAGVFVAAAVAAFSKESGVVLPGVIVLYELVWRKPERLRGAIYGLAATAVPIAVLLWMRHRTLVASPPALFPFVDNPIAGAGFWVGKLTAIKVLARYLWIAIWPGKLSADYSYSEIPLASGTIYDWLGWIVMAALLAGVIDLRPRNKAAFFFSCFAFLNLLPAANLLFPIGTIMAERLLYLPMVGIVGCLVALAVSRLDEMRLRWIAPVAVAVIAILFVGRTWWRNFDWQSDLAMGHASVQTSPDSFKVHRLLAAALYEADQSHSNIEQVVAEADRSVAILDGLADDKNVNSPWNIAAAAHIAKGDKAPAISRSEYERAVKLARRSVAIEAATRAAVEQGHGRKPSIPPVAAEGYRILASAYLKLGDGKNALAAANEARTINPAAPEGYGQIADALLLEKRGEEAVIALAEGMFLTNDMRLRADMVDLYKKGVDPAGCAVVAGPNGPALNPSCEIVRRDFCAAALRVARQDVIQQFGCQAGAAEAEHQ